MNSTSQKKTTPWSVVKYIFILLGGAFLGAALSMGTMMGMDTLIALGDALRQGAAQWLPLVQWVALAVLALVCSWFYLSGRRLVNAFWQGGGEDERLSCRAELQLSWAMALSNLLVIVCFSLWAIAALLSIHNSGGVWAFLLCTIVYMSVIQTIIVRTTQRLNPEKKGDPLSFSFSKQWMDSCDEAEKMDVYRCAYRSYWVSNITTMALWVVSIIGGVSFGTGVFPVILVSIAWLIQTGSYQLHAISLAKKRMPKS